MLEKALQRLPLYPWLKVYREPLPWKKKQMLYQKTFPQRSILLGDQSDWVGRIGY